MSKKGYGVKQHKSGLQYEYRESEIYGADDEGLGYYRHH